MTEEQIEARDKRRAAFRELWKVVAKMPVQERVAMAHKFGITTCDGRELSLCNQILVAMQSPRASFVGGFRQWLKHGRAVRKGEHGAMIWVPIGRKSEESSTEASNDEAGEKPGFIIGTVFDISQTDEVNGMVSEQVESLPVVSSEPQLQAA